MKGILALLASLLVGASIGAAATLYTVYGWPPETIVFTATEPLVAEGIEIPAGKELILDRYMPEGFATLRLYINVEGEAWSKFSTRSDARFNLIIPYWVEVGR